MCVCVMAIAGWLVVFSPAISSAAGAVVELAGDRLTVDARDVALTDLLAQLAERANLRVTFGSAPTETVTATFSGVPLDEGIRRLLRGRSFVLVYEAGQRVRELRLVGPDAARTPPAASRGQPAERGAQTAHPSPGSPAVPPGPATPVRDLARTVVEDEEATVRARATAALAAAGGAEAIGALRKALEDDAGIVRVHAVHALSRAERDAAVPLLSKVLAGDPDPQVRLAAAIALGSMPTPDARAALEGAAADANPEVRHEARRTLARLERASR